MDRRTDDASIKEDITTDELSIESDGELASTDDGGTEEEASTSSCSSRASQQSISAPTTGEPGINGIFAKFKKKLRKKADVTTSSLTSHKHDNTVPLFLSEVSEIRPEGDYEAEGLHLTREEISKLYSASASDVIIDDAFISASELVMQEIMNTTSDETGQTARKRLSSVGIVGAAGSGKTTLAEILLRKSMKSGSEETSTVVFLISVALMNLKKEMSFLDFLTSYLLPEWKCTKEESKLITEILINNADVLIIIDGLDACEDGILTSGAPPSNEFTPTTPGVFIQNILNGKLLPRARRIFTSRPSHVIDLHPSFAPQKMANIQGLTKTSQELLGRRLCGKRFDKCRNLLLKNPDLLSFCHVPYLHNLILSYFRTAEDVRGHPVTMTRILASILRRRLEGKKYRLQKEFNITKLTKMSLKAAKKGRVQFRRKDFRKSRLDVPTAARFLNFGEEFEILKVGESSSHLASIVWLEFLSALHLMLFISVREFKNELKDILELNLHRLVGFAFGITDFPVFRELQSIFPKSSSHDCGRKLLLLQKRALAQMEAHDKSSIVQSCRWAQESNSDRMRSSLRNSLPDVIDLSDHSLLPWEISQLVDVLQVTSTNRLEVLDLTGNNIGDKGATLLAQTLFNFKEVKLERCGIGRDGAREISGGLASLNSPLRKLTLSGNRIGDIGVSFVAENLHATRVLEMIDCGIELNGLHELTAKILGLRVPMKRLDLSWNHLTDAGAIALSTCVHKLLRLEVACCGFSFAGKNLIKKRLRHLNLQIFRVAFEKGAIELQLSHNGEPQDSEI